MADDRAQPGIPKELLDFAERMGFPRAPRESDEDYINRLMRMQGHIALVVRAARYGAEISFGMNSRQVREALNHRLWQLLGDHGVRQGQDVTYRDRVYRVRKIYETAGSKMNPPEVKVQLWRVDWDKDNDRGRTIYVTAIDLLRELGSPEARP
jgi:hypothetical protein